MGKLQDSVNRIFASRRFNLIAFGIITVMILISYANTFTASFHFDDNPSIVENPLIKRMTLDNVQQIIKGGRPVVYLSIMLNYAVSGLNVVGWHVFNIGLHIMNSMLVYALILMTLSLPQVAAQFRDKARRMALFAALLFGVHPIQTESVTYIISRTELLATFFYLSTMLLFAKAVQTRRFAYYIAAMISSVLAMGSKEWSVTLPAMMFLYDYMFLSEGSFRKSFSHWKGYLLITWPIIVMVSRMDLFTSHAGASAGFGVSTPTGITPLTYLLTSFNVIWTYVRLLVLPINQNLDYDYAIAKTLFEFPTILSFLGHCAVAAGGIWLYIKKRSRLIPFGIAWFYIGLSPAQSFVPIIDVIFEHRVYMPCIGFFLAFIIAYEMFFDWLGEKRMSAAANGAARG